MSKEARQHEQPFRICARRCLDNIGVRLGTPKQLGVPFSCATSELAVRAHTGRPLSHSPDQYGDANLSTAQCRPSGPQEPDFESRKLPLRGQPPKARGTLRMAERVCWPNRDRASGLVMSQMTGVVLPGTKPHRQGQALRLHTASADRTTRRPSRACNLCLAKSEQLDPVAQA